MKPDVVLALSILLAAPLGCTLPPATSSTPLTGNWTNWQIQTGTSSTTPPTALTSPPTGFYLLGAMHAQGSQVNGIFQTGAATVNFSGSFDSATSVLALSSTPAYLAFQLTLPSNLADVATGNLSVACAPATPGGATCTAIALFPAAGAEIASLTGTYSGALTSSTTPTKSGTATLTLTQSATPDSNGAFPLTATIVFPSASDLGTGGLTGTVSGEGVTLNFCSPAVIGPCISLSGSTNPAATQITISTLAFSDPGSNTFATFTGTLTRQ